MSTPRISKSKLEQIFNDYKSEKPEFESDAKIVILPSLGSKSTLSKKYGFIDIDNMYNPRDMRFRNLVPGRENWKAEKSKNILKWLSNNHIKGNVYLIHVQSDLEAFYQAKIIFNICFVGGPNLSTASGTTRWNQAKDWYLGCVQNSKSIWGKFYKEMDNYDDLEESVITSVKNNDILPFRNERYYSWFITKNKRDYLPLTIDEYVAEELGRVRNVYCSEDLTNKYGKRLGQGLSYVSTYLSLDHDLMLRLLSSVSSVNDYLTLSKEVSNWSKKYGKDLYPSDWHKFVNLELILGYKSDVSEQDFYEQVEDWVVGDIDHSVPYGSTIQFYQNMAQGISKLIKVGHWSATPDTIDESYKLGDVAFTSRHLAVSKKTSYRDFVNGITWSRGGSSTLKTNQYALIRGKRIKLSNSKNSVAIYANLDSIIPMSIDLGRPQWGKSIVKRERGKARAVLGMDLETYLPMCYLDMFIDRLLRNCTLSNLWMEPLDRHRFNYWNCLKTREQTGWFIPLDQSGFDHQVNRHMIAICLLWIKEKISLGVGWSNDLDRCMHVVYNRLVGDKRGYVTVGNTKIPVEKGVLSGWKWTALLDTLINIGEFYSAVLTMEHFGINFPFTLNAQGDDDDIYTNDYRNCILLGETYKTMNLDVNEAKFFISRSTDEYLRQVYSDGMKFGYPNRMVLTFTEINPIRDEPSDLLAEISSMVKNYVDFFKRCDPVLAARNKISKQSFLLLKINLTNILKRESILRKYILAEGYIDLKLVYQLREICNIHVVSNLNQIPKNERFYKCKPENIMNILNRSVVFSSGVIIKRKLNLRAWLNVIATPAYLGGFGLSALREHIVFKKYSVTQDIQDPEVIYPKSAKLESSKRYIKNRFGVSVKLGMSLRSTNSTNLSFRSVGYPILNVVTDTVSSSRNFIITPEVFVTMLKGTGGVRFPNSKVILEHTISSDLTLKEGLDELIPRLKNDEISRVLSCFTNSQVVQNRYEIMDRRLFQDWLTGRIDNPRPMYLSISSELVGTYYQLNLDKAISSGLNNYSQVQSLCKELELFQIPKLVKLLSDEGIHIL